MDDTVKHAEVPSEGLVVTFYDGREGLVRGEELLQCVETTNGFAKLDDLKEDLALEE